MKKMGLLTRAFSAFCSLEIPTHWTAYMRDELHKGHD